MPAPKGNQFWKARSSFGRQPIFKTPAALLKACHEYFAWVEANPILEHKVFCQQGEIIEATLPKMRAMTVSGLCLFLDIVQDTWWTYCKRDEYSAVTQAVMETIREQKFTGAAADQLNANIIARDLGLADKREFSGPNGQPLALINRGMSPQEAAEAYADTLKDT